MWLAVVRGVAGRSGDCTRGYNKAFRRPFLARGVWPLLLVGGSPPGSESVDSKNHAQPQL